MEQQSTTLYQQFADILEGGDEPVARKFLVDHIKEFPEDVQASIMMLFFEEALSHANAELDIMDMQKQGLERLDFLKKTESVLQDKLKTLKLEKQL